MFTAQVPDDEQFVPDFQSDSCKYHNQLFTSGYFKSLFTMCPSVFFVIFRLCLIQCFKIDVAIGPEDKPRTNIFFASKTKKDSYPIPVTLPSCIWTSLQS